MLAAAIAPPVVLCSLLALSGLLWYNRQRRRRAIQRDAESAYYLDKVHTQTPPTSATPLTRGAVPVSPTSPTAVGQPPPPPQQQQQQLQMQRDTSSQQPTSFGKRFVGSMPARRSCESSRNRSNHANGSGSGIGRHGRRRSRADPVLPGTPPSACFNANDMLAPPRPRSGSFRRFAAAAAAFHSPLIASMQFSQKSSSPPLPPLPTLPTSLSTSPASPRKRVRPLPPLPLALPRPDSGTETVGSEQPPLSPPLPSPPPPQPLVTPPQPSSSSSPPSRTPQPPATLPVVLQPNRLEELEQLEESEDRQKALLPSQSQPPSQSQQSGPLLRDRQEPFLSGSTSRRWGPGGRQVRDSDGLPPPYTSHVRT